MSFVFRAGSGEIEMEYRSSFAVETKRKRPAFSLIELIVAVGIVVVLGARIIEIK